MKTINQTFTNEIIIEKSKFIGIIKPLNNKDDVKNILNEIKNIRKPHIIAMDIL